MITDTLKEIESTRSKLAELERKAETERKKQLSNLHSNLGFATREELIAALRSVDGAAAKGPRGRKPKAATTKVAKKRGKRARITDDVRQQVIAALKSGEKGTKVAKDFGISLPSLQNIKKAAGMTKARK